MRRGRPWQGAELGEPCPRRIRRFLEPCLLLILHKRDTHGYELAEAVKAFGFGERNPVDASLIYRTLRWLEANGMVTSVWDTESTAGPARRVYHLSEVGEQYLAAWMADLRATEAVLASFLDEYDRHIAQDQHETTADN